MINSPCAQLLNHGISAELMDEVERVSKANYTACREGQFKEFAARTLEAGEKGADVKDVDWETRPRSRLRDAGEDETPRIARRSASGRAQNPTSVVRIASL